MLWAEKGLEVEWMCDSIRLDDIGIYMIMGLVIDNDFTVGFRQHWIPFLLDCRGIFPFLSL